MGTFKIFQDKLNESLIRYESNRAIEYGNKMMTYAQLDRCSNYIANWIVSKGFKRETFIGILIDDRSEFITTMIGILKAGSVFIPLDSAYPRARLRTMIDSTGIELVITDKINLSQFTPQEIAGKQGRQFVLLDDLFLNEESSWFKRKPDIHCNPDDKTYIYFTSGTTGKPKAIVGRNKGLLHFIDWEITTFKIDETFRFSQFTTPGFDVFLRDIFVPLCAGGTICIPGNKEIMLSNPSLVNWIDSNRINLIHCVPSLFALFNRNVSKKDNFKNLKYILFAGERVNPAELKKWFNVFEKHVQLVNLYGPTETTLAKIFYLIQMSDADKEIIPIGKPISGARIIILDENMDICDELVMGELYIRTPYRSLGYYNDPGLNKQKFIPNPFNTHPDDLIYKTGDLGRLLPDGNIELIGRIDRQVKIRGMRIELEEIEIELLKHPSVEEAVVIKMENPNGYPFLAAFVSAGEIYKRGEGDSFADNIKKYLSNILPGYMLPAVVKIIEKIPRKPNFKVDFDALSSWIQNEELYIPPGNDIEKKLAKIWAGILGIHKIGKTGNFFELGGNSLNIVPLISRIHKEFDIKISIEEVFNNPILKMQAEIIENTKKDKYIALEPVERKDYYNLSSAQKRLYILQQIDMECIAYNISKVFQLDGILDKDKLEKTFQKLVKRHDSLRTSFLLIDGKPVQRIHENVVFKIEYYETSQIVVDVLIKNFIHSFDLAKAPLVKVGLVKIGEEKYILIVDMHHIITDGVSINLLIREFMALYAEEKLSILKLQYKDYAEWQNRDHQKKKILKQEEYWLKRLGGNKPIFKLPVDYTEPLVLNVEGDITRFQINETLSREIKRIILETGTTLFMLLLAVYNVLLFLYSGEEDILIGSPTAGRSSVDIEYTIGMFVNLLVMRNFPMEDKTFREFLGEVKANVLDAFKNQDYPFDELVNKLRTQDSVTGENPLINTVFTLQNTGSLNYDMALSIIQGLKVKAYPNKIYKTKFVLTLDAIEIDGSINIWAIYSTIHFKQTTIERLKKNYTEIIGEVVKNIDIKLKDISISKDLAAPKSVYLQAGLGDFGF